MALYEFECRVCGQQRRIEAPVHEYDNIQRQTCVCGSPMDQFLSSAPGSNFKNEAGKETGMYDFDHGKKATWDLTPPGKMND